MSFQMLLLLFVSLAAVHTALALNPRAAHAARFLPSSAYTSSATSSSTTATASDDAQVLSSHSFRALAATDDAAYVGFHETTPMPVARSDHLVSPRLTSLLTCAATSSHLIDSGVAAAENPSCLSAWLCTLARPRFVCCSQELTSN